ncbi:MAG: lysophospholipid acyltransferase family protein, partial [Dehalococcoidia bacterium]|nr:lysophospholipid acyltransferase family protein [Dehalococcoidia bacterium]
PEDIKKRVTFQGWDNLERALRDGKGAILVGLHQGNWDLLGAAIALRNYPLNVVVESFPSVKLDEFVQRRRREKGMKVIPVENGVGRMVQALRRNELLALLIDIPGADNGVAVSFFEASTQVPRGAATLALKTEAKVIPISSVCIPNNTLLAVIDHYIHFQPSGDLKEDIQVLTQRIMSSLERIVRQYPDQWYMFRRMWSMEAARAES